MPAGQFRPEIIIFEFFLFSFSGWICETINETITRGKFVNKGFFSGPYTISQGIGGIGVYLICSPFKAEPLVVFAAGMAICTAVEYIMSIFLEKCFGVKCWDYTTYPHTKWCSYQGRIALTTSLFFGLITLFVVYIYWQLGVKATEFLGDFTWHVDAVLSVIFIADAVYTCTKLLRFKKAGIKIKNYAVFSDTETPE
ncbi:MAG: putative ABC transporter permease [Treponema sp.]|jgi:uncharacterized membrane protein|nr:putative ABC transporter permease [Treponema sp.]